MIKAYENYIEIENKDIEAENSLNKDKTDFTILKRIELWPANINIIQEFMKSMSQTLAVNTINNILSQINKTQKIISNKQFSKSDWKKIELTRIECQKVRDNYCDSKDIEDVVGRKLEGTGKAPAFYLVLFHVLNLVPKDFDKREFYISMFLFMLNTGQRYVSMKNVRLEDIDNVTVHENGLINVKIIVRVTKANPNVQQPFNIEGSLSDNNIMNFLYWLNRCLIIHHELDLEKYSDWIKSDKDTFLWGSKSTKYKEPVSYSTVYKTFRTFYEKAGIPSKMLGIHSFRSGFFCQAYLNSLDRGFSLEVLKELTMILAGWRSPKDQEIYAKTEMKALLTMYGISKNVTPEQMLGCNQQFINKWNATDGTESDEEVVGN